MPQFIEKKITIFSLLVAGNLLAVYTGFGQGQTCTYGRHHFVQEIVP